MALRHAPMLLTLAASASWAAIVATAPRPTAPSATAANRCPRQQQPTPDCYQDLRAAVAADRVRVRQLEAQVSHLKKALRARYAPSRSRQEIDRANEIADAEFGDLRNIPGAFHLAGDLVMEYMRDPRYQSIPLDTIVRDVNSRVAQVASAGNQTLAAEVETAKRDAAQAVADANRAINECYDKADRAITTAQAIVAGTATDADIASALAIMNRPATPPATPAVVPPIQCTSRTVGNRVETNCN